jgi:hypothetical protein
MRSHSTAATDVRGARRLSPERNRSAALLRELAQPRAEIDALRRAR